MAQTYAAQLLDALNARGITPAPADRATIIRELSGRTGALSGAQLAEFVSQFSGQVRANTRGSGSPPAFVLNNGATSSEVQQVAQELVNSGAVGPGVSASDLAPLGLPRLKQLLANWTFDGYNLNDATMGEEAGALIRLANTLRNEVNAASVDALVHLGADRLEQFRADLADAVRATSATLPKPAAQNARADEFDGYDLNADLG